MSSVGEQLIRQELADQAAVRWEFVRFRKRHLKGFQLREAESQIMDLDAVSEVASKAPCWTLFIGEKAVAIVGYTFIWNGVVEIFLAPSIHTTDHPIPYVRAVKKFVDHVWYGIVPGAHRLQSSSIADESTRKWMRILGFEREGTMRKYSRNQVDHDVWAKVR